MIKLNLHVIKKELSDLVVGEQLFREPYEPTVSVLAFHTVLPDNLQDDTLYLCPAQALENRLHRKTSGVSFLTIGLPGRKLPAQAEYLALEEHTDPFDLMNRLHRIYRTYLEWTDALQEAIDQEQPLKTLAALSMPFLNNPIALMGTGFNSYFTCLPELSPTPVELSRYRQQYSFPDNTTSPVEDIKMLVGDADYIRAAQTPTPSIYPGNPFGYSSLYQNVYNANGIQIARLLVDAVIRPFEDRDFFICRILGSYYAKALMRSYSKTFHYSQELEQILTHLLNHKLLPEERILNALKGLEWEVTDLYVCMNARLMTRNEEANALSPIAHDLSAQLCNECYTIRDGCIVMVFNLTKLAISQERLLNRIIPVLRDSMLRATFSNSFRDFKLLCYHYRQNLRIEAIGRQKNPTQWYFLHKDFVLDDLLETCTSGTVISIYMLPELRILQEYDEKNHTDYLNLLRVYLDCERNIAQTARVTYLHRNTVIYRLKRIEELTGSTFYDGRQRLLCQLYFLMEDRSRKF